MADPVTVAILPPSQVVRTLLAQGLSPERFSVQVIDVTGPEVVADLSALKPGLIFLSAVMPGIDGLELCDLIRATPELAESRLVFISSDEASGEAAFRHRADHFLTIPFSARDVARLANYAAIEALTVVYAEDSQVMHSLVVPALKDDGYRVLEAWNAEQALEFLARQDVNLVISDIEMPGMSGYTLCSTMKSDERNRQIPVILQSSLETEEAVERGFRSGADDYIIKPVVLPELLSRVRRILRPRPLLRQEHVLLAEGDGRVSGSLAQALAANGLQVEARATGEEAFRLAGERPYQLAIIDHELNAPDGSPLYRALRGLDRLADMPIILLGERGSRAEQVRIRSAGIQAFITKPFQNERVTAEAERLLAEYRLCRQNELMHHYLSGGAVSAIQQRSLREETPIIWDKHRTILFTDIVKFTTLCEHKTSREVVSLLNLFFERMVDCLLRHDAIIDKFIGDAILALFGRQQDGAHRAVAAAFAMLAALPELRERTGADLHIRVGINSGHVIVGDIGSVASRRDFTAIGDNVNIAERLEGEAEADCVLISQSTRELLGDLVTVGLPESFALKGKQQAVIAYRVLAVKPYQAKG